MLVHGPAEVSGVTPAWCYSTLADADCYTLQIPGASDRLIGAYVPVEASTEPAVVPVSDIGPRGQGDIDRRRSCQHPQQGSRVCAHEGY